MDNDLQNLERRTGFATVKAEVPKSTITNRDLDSIEELKIKLEKLEKELEEQKKEFEEQKRVFEIHTHTGRDGSSQFYENIELPTERSFDSGQSGWLGQIDKVTGEIKMSLSCGDATNKGVSNSSTNSQLDLVHQTNGRSFFQGFRPPLFTGFDGSVSGATLRQSTHNFTSLNLVAVDDLYLIIIDTNNSSEVRKITSFTRFTLTVDNPFTFSGSDFTWILLQPMYLGSSLFPWKRAYVSDGESSGIRFGVGDTGESSNCLLYFKDNKLIIKWLDGLTTRYKYLDLSGTGVTWAHSTTAP